MNAGSTDGGAGRFPAARGLFSAVGRTMTDDDVIVLTSVGVDIGSSTSHLIFSRLELEREGSGYATTKRDVLYASKILLTPYVDETTIDQEALGDFIEGEYQAAGIERDSVDTGALILTGSALLRANARAIGELFAGEAGRFVSVSAGDNLEATMAAHGSGAIALSESRGGVMNIDMGGGTTKVVICRHGRAADIATLDIGARLVAHDGQMAVTRIEETGRRIADRLGIDLRLGAVVGPEDLRSLARYMVTELLGEVAAGGESQGSPLLRTPALKDRSGISAVTFSGGVSEFVYDRSDHDISDLGQYLAQEVRERATEFGAPVVESAAGIQGTVIGASQHTIQVSGNTIYLDPTDTVPVRNVLVVRPDFPWHEETLESESIASAIREALRRFDQLDPDAPVAIATAWEGSATYQRIKAFCRGLVDGMRPHMQRGHPLTLVCDSDIGGLLGLHFREDLRLDSPIISVDGLDLREFNYIDIGALIPSSGAVPVVIKSLAFASETDPDRTPGIE
jgi:ethanolamine utilization protein EutA